MGTHRSDEGRVSVGRPNVLDPVELSVLGQVLLGIQVRVSTIMMGHLQARYMTMSKFVVIKLTLRRWLSSLTGIE